MGSIGHLMEMIPGMSSMAKKLPEGMDEKQLKKVEAIVRSMTKEERQHPDMIDGSRRRRIAKGSGTTSQDVNQLLNQFRQVPEADEAIGFRQGQAPDVRE